MSKPRGLSKCPNCGENISVAQALFKSAKHPFRCSHCGAQLEKKNTLAPLGVIAFLVYFNYSYGRPYYPDKVLIFLIVCLILSIISLAFTPVYLKSDGKSG